MMTLFIMMTTEGWTEVMHHGIDSTGVGMQPKKNANLSTVVFFIAFMIVGSQFIMNTFVGVVIDNFNTIKLKEELGNTFVTEQQKSWIELQATALKKTLRKKAPPPPGFRGHIFKFVNHKHFDRFITACIILNTAIMAGRHNSMSKEQEQLSDLSNYIFAFVFNVEMVLMLLALGWFYFSSLFNIFDVVIVIATDLGIVFELFESGGNFSTTATVIRGFRLMRLLRLIKTSTHLRLIIDTVVNILPQVINVMSLLLLLLFIYASFAINLFSGVMLQEHLDEKNNFQTFSSSMLILLRFSTGEGWN
jgi:hypothetical protein